MALHLSEKDLLCRKNTGLSEQALAQLQQKMKDLPSKTKKRQSNRATRSTFAPAGQKKTMPQDHLRNLLAISPELADYRGHWIEDFDKAAKACNRKFEIDFALPDLKVGIEVDGWQYHGKHKESFLRDRDKDYFLAVNGWQILRVQAGLLSLKKHHPTVIDRISAFLDVWVPRQRLILAHFDSADTKG